MKARVVYGPPGFMEVEVKQAWYLPWQFYCRGSKSHCQRVANRINGVR